MKRSANGASCSTSTAGQSSRSRSRSFHADEIIQSILDDEEELDPDSDYDDIMKLSAKVMTC